MVFLPHWSSFVDVLWLFVYSSIGAMLMVWLSRLQSVQMRCGAMGAMGLVMAVLMVNALPSEGGLAAYLFLGITLTALFALIAYTDYLALRLVVMGSIGVAIGTVLFFMFQSEGFVRGFFLDRSWHLILPIICLTYGGFAFLTKLTRTAVLENLLADYARTARAKGVSESDVLWRHVFRNSLLPLITVSATLLPGLLGGSVIVESIFSIDGMGKLAIEAVKGRDRELVLSITLISGVLTLVGYLIADLCYALADPRVSYD